jgi:hypothetical protein
VKDVDDFFTQVCNLASKPLAAMETSSTKTLDGYAAAVRSAGYEIFQVREIAPNSTRGT